MQPIAPKHVVEPPPIAYTIDVDNEDSEDSKQMEQEGPYPDFGERQTYRPTPEDLR